MPTKPANQPEAWATNANYTTGPFIGSPSKVVPGAAVATEGHRPGALFPTAAEHENSQQNRITALARWLFLGTYNPDPDAHVVETDSTGRAGLHGLDVVNTDAAETAVDITAATTVGNPGVLVTCTAGADAAVEVDIGAASTFAFSTATGAGAFAVGYFVAMTGSGAGAAGYRCSANAGTSGPAIDVDHAGTGTAVTIDTTGAAVGLDVNVASGTGAGIIVDGNATTTAVVATGGAGQGAIAGVSGNNAIAAIGGAGVGTAIGVTGDGGSGSSAATGVRGTGVHADAHGVHGRTSVSASTTAAGVFGEGRGTNTFGVYARSDSGIGLKAQGDASSPANPAVYIVGQDTDPTNGTFGGELISNSTMRQLRHAAGGNGYFGVYQGGGPGMSACLANFSAEGPHTSNSGVIWTLCMQPYLAQTYGNGYYGLTAGAELTIVIGFEGRCQTAAAGTISLQVLDQTDGGTVIYSRAGTGNAVTAGYRLTDATTTEWQRGIIASFQYAPPNEGQLDLDIEIRVGDGAGANIEARDMWCQIWGSIVP